MMALMFIYGGLILEVSHRISLRKSHGRGCVNLLLRCCGITLSCSRRKSLIALSLPGCLSSKCFRHANGFYCGDIYVPDSCVLCSAGHESHQHLFISCPFAASAWSFSEEGLYLHPNGS